MAPPPATGIVRAVEGGTGGVAAVVPPAPGIPIRVPVGVPAGVARVARVVVARSPAAVVVGVDAVPGAVSVGPSEAQGRADEDRARAVVGGAEAEAHTVEERTDADGEGDVALRCRRRGGEGRRGDQDQWAARCGSHGVLQVVVTAVLQCNPHAMEGRCSKHILHKGLRQSTESVGTLCVRGGGHIVDISGTRSGGGAAREWKPWLP